MEVILIFLANSLLGGFRYFLVITNSVFRVLSPLPNPSLEHALDDSLL